MTIPFLLGSVDEKAVMLKPYRLDSESGFSVKKLLKLNDDALKLDRAARLEKDSISASRKLENHSCNRLG